MVTNSTGFVTLTADEAIDEGERVMMAGDGNVDLAGANEVGIGVATRNTASGGLCPIKLWNAPGTFPVRTSAAVARGAQLRCAAAGEFDDGDAGTTPAGLIALEASGADGDIIEAIPYGRPFLQTVDTTIETDITALDALTFTTSTNVTGEEVGALRDAVSDLGATIAALLITIGVAKES